MEEEHQSASPPKENPAPGRNTNFEGEDAGKVKLAKALSLAAVIMAGIAFFMAIVDSIICRYSETNLRTGATVILAMLEEKCDQRIGPSRAHISNVPSCWRYMDLWWLDTIIGVGCAVSAFVLLKIKKGTCCIIIILAAIGVGFAGFAIFHTFGACIICADHRADIAEAKRKMQEEARKMQEAARKMQSMHG